MVQIKSKAVLHSYPLLQRHFAEAFAKYFKLY